MSPQSQTVDYDALAQQHGASAAPVDYDALAQQHGADSESSAPKGFMGKLWDAVNTPIADFVLPKGIKTSDILKGAIFEHLGLGTYVPGQNDFETIAKVHLGDSPTKAAVKAFLAGSTNDSANLVSGMTSPLSLATMAGGVLTKAPGAAGTAAKAVMTGLGTGIAGKGVADIAKAGTENTPEAWQERLEGGAELAGGAAVAVPGIAAAGSKAILLGKTPQEAYQSALKPSTTIPRAKVERIVNTGLENEIPVSKSGSEKLSSLLDDLHDRVTAEIGAGQGKTVNKFKIASRLSDTAAKFSTQVNPEADLNAVSDAGNEFLRTQPGEIPAADAQALKVGTYRQLGSKAYGELKGATIESQKALARGIKEELANQFPELSSLNAAEGSMYDLQPVLEKAIQRQGNHQILGIGTPIAAGATKAVTGSSTLAAVAGAVKAVVDNPIVKSRLAIALSKGGMAPSVANARIRAYSAALAASAANSETEGDHATQ